MMPRITLSCPNPNLWMVIKKKFSAMSRASITMSFVTEYLSRNCTPDSMLLDS